MDLLTKYTIKTKIKIIAFSAMIIIISMLASLLVFSSYFENITASLDNNNQTIRAVSDDFKKQLLSNNEENLSKAIINQYFYNINTLTNTKLQNRKNKSLESLLNTFIVMLSILLILFMFFGYLLDQTISKSLHSLKSGMKSFFDYVMKNGTKVEKIEIIYEDEIGTILHFVNENLEDAKKIIEKEREFNIKLKENILKQTKELTEKSNYLEQYKYMIDEAESIIQFDIFGNIINVNEHYCTLSKYNKEELIGKPIIDFINSDNPNSGFVQEITNVIKEGTVYKGINSDIKKDGTKFTTKTVILPMIPKDGIIENFFCIRTDITPVITLTNEIIATQKDVISTMGEIGESRSKETGLHVKRVAEYSKLLASQYGLTKEQCDLICFASPMHDIGKVGIPDAILNKPGKLTPEEYEVMKTHPTIGYNMLKNSKREILSAAAIISHEHHEKFDGSGYPNQKVGEDIHIFGRITAIADIFDALGSDRCYKKAWDLEDILKLMKEQKGKHFDPELVDLFIENLDEFLEIRDKYKDPLFKY